MTEGGVSDKTSLIDGEWMASSISLLFTLNTTVFKVQFNFLKNKLLSSNHCRFELESSVWGLPRCLHFIRLKASQVKTEAEIHLIIILIMKKLYKMFLAVFSH